MVCAPGTPLAIVSILDSNRDLAVLVLNRQRESAIAHGFSALSWPDAVSRNSEQPPTQNCQGYSSFRNHTTTERAVYFAFLNSAKARDAYAYSLYHKRLGPCDTTLILHAPREAILTTLGNGAI